jgi:hypothetical protein
MAMDRFTVEFDTNGNITKVVDTAGKTTVFADFTEISKDPLFNVHAVTFTQVFMANSCYVYQNGRKVKVC